LDFSENLTAAAFFATHRVIDGRWEPSRTGTGVIYLIRPLRDEDDLVFFEIGIQPLPRPFAQKGSLLYVEPGLNLLDHPAVRAFGFRHDEGCSRTVAKQLGGPQALFPDDKFGDLIEAHKLDTYVTRDSIERFLQDVPSEFKDDRRKELRELLGSSTEFRG
jgi:hypothetical protein